MTQQAEVTKEIILKKVVVSRVTLQETPNGLIDSTRVLGATCLRERNIEIYTDGLNLLGMRIKYLR